MSPNSSTYCFVTCGVAVEQRLTNTTHREKPHPILSSPTMLFADTTYSRHMQPRPQLKFFVDSVLQHMQTALDLNPFYKEEC